MESRNKLQFASTSISIDLYHTYQTDERAHECQMLNIFWGGGGEGRKKGKERFKKQGLQVRTD